MCRVLIRSTWPRCFFNEYPQHMFSHKLLHLLEADGQGASNEYPQHMFSHKLLNLLEADGQGASNEYPQNMFSHKLLHLLEALARDF